MRGLRNVPWGCSLHSLMHTTLVEGELEGFMFFALPAYFYYLLCRMNEKIKDPSG